MTQKFATLYKNEIKAEINIYSSHTGVHVCETII